MEKRRRVREARDKRQEQRSYERVPVRLTVRCRVVGARLAVSLSACQPTHVGTMATGLACRFTYRHLASQSHTRRALLHRGILYACGKWERVRTRTSTNFADVISRRITSVNPEFYRNLFKKCFVRFLTKVINRTLS